MDSANFGRNSDLNDSGSINARLNNRAARFYWAEEESSPQRAHAIQHIMKSDSHFEESPLVIAAISAGVIGVAIIVIILVGIWIRSRLFSVVGGRSGDNPNNMSVRSSTSTLDEEAYVVCVEMDGESVLGSMKNAPDNYCENSTTLELEMETNEKVGAVPESANDDQPTTSTSLHSQEERRMSEMDSTSIA